MIKLLNLFRRRRDPAPLTQYAIDGAGEHRRRFFCAVWQYKTAVYGYSGAKPASRDTLNACV